MPPIGGNRRPITRQVAVAYNDAMFMFYYRAYHLIPITSLL